MTKEERLLKSCKTGLQSALNILDNDPVNLLEINMVRAAANQALQSAGELYTLLGLLTNKLPQSCSWHVFEKFEYFKVIGRGDVYSVDNPADCNNFRHLIDKVVEVDNKFCYVTMVEFQRGLGGFVRKGEKIGLIVRPATAQEIMNLMNSNKPKIAAQ